jgi:hypothetical protein
MFLFNKSSALPRSRQSSIDSLGTDPSNSDVWMSQCSDTSSPREVSSPEPRDRQHSSKRSSVFNLRNRSNTSTSTLSFASLSSAMTGMDGSSQDLRQTSSSPPSFLEIPGPRRSLFRGRKSKRQSNQLASAVGLEEDVKGMAALRKDQSRRSARHTAQNSIHDLRNRISSPFDFQHLTHTDPAQFAALERTSGSELVAEFSAVRASQIPHRGLNGIKAEDLHFQNFSSDDLTSPEPRSVSAFDSRSPPLSPEPHHDSRPGSSHGDGRKTLRLSRSVESFSQPGVRSRVHRHTQSAVAPPRTSSRLALTRIDDLPEEFPSSNCSSSRSSGMWDHVVPLSPPTNGEQLAPIADEADFVGHAVTTPDDSAISVTPPYTPGLENVPEEEERFFNPRPAPRPPLRSQRSRPPSFDAFSFRTSPRSPISRTNGRGSPLTSPKNTSQRGPITRPISQMSDTLGSPALCRRGSVRRSPPRRLSNTWRALDDSWEEDIDFMYDHEMEAGCDWDWDRGSDNGSEDRELTPGREVERPRSPNDEESCSASIASEDESTVQTRFLQSAFRPSLLVPSTSSVPELESRSAVSASTADSGIRTPSDYFPHQTTLVSAPAPFTEAEGFTLTPSLLVPQDFKEQSMREEMYEDLLAEYESSDRHFALLDASQSVASSSRNSHIRSSKRSSYDSSLVSTQGSGSWSSPVRRSASSSCSLPELVHSRRARKNFDMVVDHLSEQVASFASFEEDEILENDDDTTPPGRQLNASRTFFAADEDHDEVIPNSTSVSEFSPSASQPHHKHAASDGAAKLLASPMQNAQSSETALKTRKRAASSSTALRANRPAQLSLFPQPPRYMVPHSARPNLGS